MYKIYLVIIVSFFSCQKPQINFLKLQESLVNCKTYEDVIAVYKGECIQVSDDKLFMKTGIVGLGNGFKIIISYKKRGVVVINKKRESSFQFQYNKEILQNVIMNQSGIYNLEEGIVKEDFDFLITVIESRVLVFKKSTKELFYLYRKPR